MRLAGDLEAKGMGKPRHSQVVVKHSFRLRVPLPDTSTLFLMQELQFTSSVLSNSTGEPQRFSHLPYCPSSGEELALVQGIPHCTSLLLH